MTDPLVIEAFDYLYDSDEERPEGLTDEWLFDYLAKFADRVRQDERTRIAAVGRVVRGVNGPHDDRCPVEGSTNLYDYDEDGEPCQCICALLGADDLALYSTAVDDGLRIAIGAVEQASDQYAYATDPEQGNIVLRVYADAIASIEAGRAQIADQEAVDNS